jgi:hypothetical protein
VISQVGQSVSLIRGLIASVCDVVTLYTHQVSTITRQVALHTCFIPTRAGSVSTITRLVAPCPHLVVVCTGLVPALGSMVALVT